MQNHTYASRHADVSSGAPAAERIRKEALAWAKFVLANGSMPTEQVIGKALQALLFSVCENERRGDIPGFVVPSKLVGVRAFQEAIETLRSLNPPAGAQFDLEEHQGRLAASYGGMLIGYVQPKHAWLRPLVAHGATLHLLQVTGTREGHTRGVNVAFGSLAQALRSYEATRAH